MEKARQSKALCTMKSAALAVLAYHEASKHHMQRYAPGPAFLDWDTQPDPFRRYPGAALIELELHEQPPEACTYDQLYRGAARTVQSLSAPNLGLWLELAFGLSAWKSNGVERWALRNNPSSGNLHPTEAYLLLWRSVADDLPPGLYHYAPHEHALERRALLSAECAAKLCATHPGSFGALGLSSILWREAWKYGARAYRYVQLDVGHALAGARIAAQVLGWTLRLDACAADDAIAACLGLDRDADFVQAEREEGDLLALLGTSEMSDTPQVDWDDVARSLGVWAGRANPLSRERQEWPQISQLSPAVRKPATPPPMPPVRPPHGDWLADAPPLDACRLIRQRRSAQRMDPQAHMPLPSFDRLLQSCIPTAQCPPFDTLPYPPALHLLLFVHAIDDLQAGLYLLPRHPAQLASLQQHSDPSLQWIRNAQTQAALYQLRAPLDLRRDAAHLSCHQGIAGHGVFSLAMLADLSGALENEGAWVYRRLYWEAGMIGQQLYLHAEALGLQGTGIGCFFDDEVLRSVGMQPTGAWQVLYHFTVGRAIQDSRLQSAPAYSHLSGRGRSEPSASTRT
ncbi:MAG: nitroreductase family protein [Pseudomonadota bacterium]